MATVTASLLEGANVKAVHTGVVAVGAVHTQTTTLTASSVFLLNNVPDGATLVDWWLRYQDNAAGQALEIGTSFTPCGIMAQTSLTITFSSTDSTFLPLYGGHMNQRAYMCPFGGDRMPVRISLSDDVQPAQVRVEMRIRLTISASAQFTWTLFYTMDGVAGHTTIR